MARSLSKLGARGLTATDVLNALTEQNVEIPGGQFGEPPSDAKQAFQIPVRVVGRLTSPSGVRQSHRQEFPERPGAVEGRGPCRDRRGEPTALRFKYSGFSTPMGIGVEQLSNANALDVDRQAKVALEESP